MRRQLAHPSRQIAIALVVVATLAAASAAEAQLQWTSKDESSSFKIGLLSQVQGEIADVAGSDDQSKNLFIRRARILMSYELDKKLSVFLETDSPNLGKAAADGTKNSGDIFIQDFVVAYKLDPSHQIEAGMLLPATSYNHTQSAATLLPVDYGTNTFAEGGALGARVGRDYGLQARGYLAENKLEYRLGVFQGARGANATNAFRYSGRVMYQLFTPQTSLFYRGTSFGKTKTVSFGASFDTQEDYFAWSGDVFVDLPLGGGNGLTVKGELSQLDGDDFLTTLPEQTNLLVEAGYYFGSAKLMPFLQYAARDYDASTSTDEDRLAVGLAYVPKGHNNNLKLSYTRIDPDGGDTSDQWILQWQFFLF